MKVLNSIRTREDQFEQGLISQEERLRWLRLNHPNLSIGDWEDLGRITKLDAYVTELVTANADLRSVIKQLNTKLEQINEEPEHDVYRSLAHSAKQRNDEQAKTIGELIEERDSLERMVRINQAAAKLIKSEPDIGDWVVVHTSVNYDPSVTIVPEDEFSDYFNEDNGWEPLDIPNIRKLMSGEMIQADNGLAITIVRV